MEKKPLVIVILAVFLILGVAFWLYFRTGMNTPPDQQDTTPVTEEYRGNNCKFRIQEENTQKQILCSFSVHQNLPPYIFRITSSKGENAIERIEIFPENQPNAIQTFSHIDTYPSVERIFEAQDINFDGYLDIGTIAWYGTAGFTGYQYWIFDPANNNFRLDTQFVTLGNPKLLPEKKQILADDAKEGSVAYEWRDGTLTKIEK